MDRLFRFDMYPADWLVDTSDLEEGELAVFTQVIMLLYARRGDLDNDPQFIAQKIRNMSIRKCRSLLDKLFEKGFLTLSAGKISQKRAEKELNMKRTHLENSSKGGRNRAENVIREPKNNDLISSEGKNSLSSPIAIATATPKATANIISKPKKSPRQNRSDFQTDALVSMSDWFHENAPSVDAITLRNKLLDWCDATGKTYKDYYAALRTWAKKEQEQINRQGNRYGSGHRNPTTEPKSIDDIKHLRGAAALSAVHGLASGAMRKTEPDDAFLGYTIDHEPD